VTFADIQKPASYVRKISHPYSLGKAWSAVSPLEILHL